METASTIKAKKQTKNGQRKGILLPLAYIYAFAPTLIFVFFWLRWIIAIPLGIVILLAVYLACAQDEPIKTPVVEKSHIPVICVALCIIVLWVLFSGVGGSVAQYPDHILRNSVFKLLVDNQWPVTMEVGEKFPRGLSYYIGFWLPAAYIAKFTSYRVGLLFLQIWAGLGLYLVWRSVCEKRGETKIWFLVVFIFFGGADAIGRLLTGSAYSQVGNRYEWWSVIFNYPGVSTGLFWAFNQVIYAWLIYCLLERQRSNKALILIWSATMLTSTFAAVGMIPFVVYWACRNVMENDETVGIGTVLSKAIKKSVTMANGVGVVIALLTTSFLLSNGAMTAVNEDAGASSYVVNDSASNAVKWGGVDSGMHAYGWTTMLWIYLLFILLEVGIYYMLIYKSEKQNPLFWISLAVLLICPLIHVGWNIDFCMRASVPALFCLYNMVIDSLSKYRRKGERVLFGLLVVALLVGSVSTFDTMYGAAKEMGSVLKDKQKVSLYVRDDKMIMKDYNFTSSTNSFFYKYLAGGRKSK